MEENIFFYLIEPNLKPSKIAKKDIQESRKEYKKGNFLTFEEVKKELGF